MKVLLVNDDAADLRAIAHIMKSRGYEVVTAENGELALDVLRTNPAIDALLTDLGLPGISGYDVLRETRKINPQVRTFLGSAASSRIIELTAGSLGAEAIFLKPYDFDQICKILG